MIRKRSTKSASAKRGSLNLRAERVGYGKPPRAHQFKPGESGNPKGRPKGAKSEATIMQELFQHKITVNERGRVRKITLLEGILRKIAEDCLKGNVKSSAFLLNRYHAITAGEVETPSMSEDDEKVLNSYLTEFRKKITGEKL
ncbi:DUF5681 domain-containing protein [Tardiphaga sp.]|jgi:hypothetical protein|uniref:DUF5681 domain-containing protein n=1 Tax=Tardiphaga sp. TaxID=1926292 RepID=UPI0037D9A143